MPTRYAYFARNTRASRQAEREEDGADAEDHPFERLGARLGQETEVEELAEEMTRQTVERLVADSPGHAALIVSRMSRATGVKSACWVTRTKRSSSGSADGRMHVGQTTLGDEAARRQNDDARAEFLDHVEPVRAEENHPAFGGEERQSSARNSRPAFTSRPENGSSSTRRSGLCSSAAASSTRCRMPFEKALIVRYRLSCSWKRWSSLEIFSSSGALPDSAQPADERQVLGRGQMRVEVRFLGHVANAPLVLDGIVRKSGCRRARSIPALGSSSPTTRLTVVLLPDPFGPR